MSIFEITIRSKENSTDGWPVSVKLEHRDGLSIQKSGILPLDEEDFQWLSTRLSQCKDYGTRLGQRLFQNDLLLAFREAFAGTQKLMRVLLTLEVGEDDPLKTLRWERLCAPIDGSWEHLALNQRSPFSQYLPTSNSDRTYPAIARSDLRALVMVASPEGLEDFSLEHFDVERTVSELREALGEIPCDVLAHGVPDAAGEPTLNQLCEFLSAANPPYTLLHIVCHGAVRGGKTVLYWGNEANRVEPVLEQNLMRRLRQLGNKEGLPHLTFLCSCSSGSPLGGLAQSLVRELAMPAIVAMTDRVSVKTGLALAGSFYPRLWDVGAVDIALQQATAGLVERYDIVVPALFGRLRDRPLFDIALQPPQKTAPVPNPNPRQNGDERDDRDGEFEYDAYISYVDEEPDSTWVWDVLVPRLEEAGLAVAVSGETDLIGVAKVVNMEQGLRLSRRTLVILSELYLADTAAEFENVMVQTMGIEEGTARLVLVYKDAADPQNLPYRLKQLTGVKLNHPRRAEREFQKLTRQLKQPLPRRTSDGLYKI